MSLDVEIDVNEVPKDNAIPVGLQPAFSKIKKQFECNGHEPIDNESDDEFAVRFSAAQLKVKIEQAKLEAKVEADAKLLAARKELMEQSIKVADLKREWENAVGQCVAVQTRLDAVLMEHKQTLDGMRDDLQLEKVRAMLDVEKTIRQKLQEAFEKQQEMLALAQERVEKLTSQVASYQKTETVLAQSVAHLQHRFTSKDEQRAASVENVHRAMIEQHEQEKAELCEKLSIAQGTEMMAQKQLQELQKELKVLRDNALKTLVSPKNVEQELQAKITQLETEKAVLRSKAEQVQKADTQLRSQLHAQCEEIASLNQEKEKLQQDNKELGEIASDLMRMAERQHSENVGRGSGPTRLTRDVSSTTPGSTHEEDGIFLQKRKKRLRMSLG